MAGDHTPFAKHLYTCILIYLNLYMGKQTISLSVEKKVYEQYSKACKEQGMIISKQVENFMKEKLEGSNEKKYSK